jgi:fatty acid-binding protein DegV
VIDGAVEEAGKVRTRSKALQFVLDKIPEGNVESISILHSSPPDLDQFIAMVQPKVPDAEMIVARIGPVVGVHVGPRAVGLTWIERHD